MIIFKILIWVGVIIFLLFALVFTGAIVYAIVKIYPQIRKENYLLSRGYYCDKGYWCKDDRSLSESIVYAMNYHRLVDYVDRMEEK